MNEFLKLIGLKIESEKVEGSFKLYYITNPDSSIRWVWNANNPNPDFIKFYSASNLKTKLVVLAFKMIFKIRLQHIIFSKKSIYASFEKNHVMYDFIKHHFALFTGTKGPNRKLVLYISHENKTSKFIKIALSDASKELIIAENKQLAYVENLKNVAFEVPKSFMLTESIVVMNDISNGGKNISIFNQLHINALSEIYQKSVKKETFENLTCHKKSLSEIKEVYSIQNPKISKTLIDKVSFLLHETQKIEVQTCYAHKDFTPWNTICQQNSLSIFDWELASENMPFAFDLFHFIIQKGILTERKNWGVIKKELLEAYQPFAKKNNVALDGFDDYLKAYLAINTAYYLKIYALQADWHIQISWLLNTWNEACTDVLRDIKPYRKHLISDIFCFLHNQEYAAIKLEEIPPESISEYSDIDLCMSKKLGYETMHYVQKHTLVRYIHVKKSTNMIAIMVVLHDGTTLALDLIWEFKRKSIQFMDLKPVLNHTIKNVYHIKTMSEQDTKMYINCFYTLNNSGIPKKYMSFFSDERSIKTKKELMELISKNENNRGLKKLTHYFSYLKDTIIGQVMSKGIILTFSGVDGAGKSTIIEHTALEIEKKFRRKVVVIRHRPSILPIISAIKHGKSGAEKRSVQNLPRQGNNKNFFSSFFRFLYYFTDYVFGQFVIYIKYVLRGYVVLYDRYYFDFINDSVRSNIRLPKWILNFGYRCIMSPDLNIFLYADAKTILKRKQELEESTIISLTNDYLRLFSTLSAREKKGVYLCIENIELEKTMKTITENIAKKLL